MYVLYIYNMPYFVLYLLYFVCTFYLKESISIRNRVWTYILYIYGMQYFVIFYYILYVPFYLKESFSSGNIVFASCPNFCF